MGLLIFTELSIGTLFTLYVVPAMYMFLAADHEMRRSQFIQAIALSSTPQQRTTNLPSNHWTGLLHSFPRTEHHEAGHGQHPSANTAVQHHEAKSLHERCMNGGS